jgi:hypothetical protein
MRNYVQSPIIFGYKTQNTEQFVKTPVVEIISILCFPTVDSDYWSRKLSGLLSIHFCGIMNEKETGWFYSSPIPISNIKNVQPIFWIGEKFQFEPLTKDFNTSLCDKWKVTFLLEKKILSECESIHILTK